MIPAIVTARLRLVAITPAMLDAEVEGVGRLATLVQARVPGEWPDENWEPHVFDFIRCQYTRHPDTQGWNRYVVLPGDAAVLIGTVGAFPLNEHEAEIGYTILKPWRGCGFATEAAQALIALLQESLQTSSVIAHTFPHLQESVRVMEKCGFAFDGAGDEGTVRYRLNCS